MFTFFKKQEVKESVVIDSKFIQADIQRTFKEVLKEFGLSEYKETEIEALKTSLENFKSDNSTIYDKIKKLTDLNLTSTPSAKNSLAKLKEEEEKIRVKIMDVKKDINKAEKINSLIAKYAIEYPTYKFIDTQTMIDIMVKYNLVLGEAFTYAKEIPTENLEVISYFTSKVKETEQTYNLSSRRSGSFSYYYIEKEHKAAPSDCEGFFIKDPMRYFNDKHLITSYTSSALKIIAPESHFKVPTFTHENAYRDSVEVPIMKLDKATRMFKFSTEQLNELEKIKMEILDPIAVLEVDSGFIILTAWDEEADIPEIQNTFLN